MKRIREILRRTEDFVEVYVADGFVFAFKEICDLTAFFVPRARKAGEEFHIDYELGLVVVENRFDRTACFKQKIANRQYVILPRILPSGNTLECFTDGKRMKKWLVDQLSEDMRRFCLPSVEALSLIEQAEDRFIESLKRVYKSQFTETIVAPLKELQETPPS